MGSEQIQEIQLIKKVLEITSSQNMHLSERLSSFTTSTGRPAGQIIIVIIILHFIYRAL